MKPEQEPINLVQVAQSFHRGAFHELRATLSALKGAATMGRLGRHEQALLLELAEYGLFYTSFYDRLIRHLRAADQGQPEQLVRH